MEKVTPSSDLAIAQAAKLKPMAVIADRLGIPNEALEPYGRTKAKLPLDLIQYDRLAENNLVLVTAITPTPAGEGKTTTSIGLADGLNKIGEQACVVLREPSLGPVFGMKGGAAGGGYAQVIPMVDINLHFTGDFAMVEKANNVLAAIIDNYIHHNVGEFRLDPRTIVWKRVIDMNDRSLRNMTIGLGGKSGGVPRESGFNITAASEVMAILCMSKNLADLKERLGNIYVGDTIDKKAVHARDLDAEGAMALLLSDAIKPNLVQTLEGTPAIVHGGPFANIAQGTNTLVATQMGLSRSRYAVTEAGFGADLGAEKFLNIKCRAGGLSPSVVVLTATIRALKFHGGAAKDALMEENLEALHAGLPNLERHVKNLQRFGVPVVVAINRFASDTEAEMAVIRSCSKSLGVACAPADGWAKGGDGMTELAKAVVAVAESGAAQFKPLYPLDMTIAEKIKFVATNMYGATNINYTPKARADMRRVERLGLENLPICMAKTQYAFSDRPEHRGIPTDFELTVREVEIAAGAGFIIPITGTMMRMPGLPKVPAALGMDIDDKGHITGLS